MDIGVLDIAWLIVKIGLALSLLVVSVVLIYGLYSLIRRGFRHLAHTFGFIAPFYDRHPFVVVGLIAVLPFVLAEIIWGDW